MNLEVLISAGRKLRALALEFGGPGVLLIAFADSSFVPIPQANEVLIVMLSIGESWGKMLYYVLMATSGSVFGSLVLFLAGKKAGEALIKQKFSAHKIKFVQRVFKKSGVLMIFVSSMLPPPTPFKLCVLSSSIAGLRVDRFILAVFFGRALRYLIWGVLTVLYGAPVKRFIEANMHTIGITLLLVFCLVIIIVIAFNLLSRKSRE